MWRQASGVSIGVAAARRRGVVGGVAEDTRRELSAGSQSVGGAPLSGGVSWGCLTERHWLATDAARPTANGEAEC